MKPAATYLVLNRRELALSWVTEGVYEDEDEAIRQALEVQESNPTGHRMAVQVVRVVALVHRNGLVEREEPCPK